MSNDKVLLRCAARVSSREPHKRCLKTFEMPFPSETPGDQEKGGCECGRSQSTITREEDGTLSVSSKDCTIIPTDLIHNLMLEGQFRWPRH